jgi:hypothetical protein
MTDPSGFGDPIAGKTQWTPLVPGGANFATHTLVLQEGARVEMKPSTGLRLFGAAFLLAGAGCSLAGLLAPEWPLVVFGIPFAAAGIYVLWPRTILFDGGARVFTGPKGQVPFSAIHAIQIIKERVTSSEDSDYWSYELNLVLTTGDRINVVDHGNQGRVRADARTISALLGCKLWDAAGTH